MANELNVENNVAENKAEEKKMFKYVLKVRMYNPTDDCDLSRDDIKTLLAETAKAYSVKGYREVSIKRCNKAMVAISINSMKPIDDVRRWLVGYSHILYEKIEKLTETKRRVFTVADFVDVTEAAS